jgi:hypothetical protein
LKHTDTGDKFPDTLKQPGHISKTKTKTIKLVGMEYDKLKTYVNQNATKEKCMYL